MEVLALLIKTTSKIKKGWYRNNLRVNISRLIWSLKEIRPQATCMILEWGSRESVQWSFLLYEFVFALTLGCCFSRFFFNNGLKMSWFMSKGCFCRLECMYYFPTILANPRGSREVLLGETMARENLEEKNYAGFQVTFPRFSFLLSQCLPGFISVYGSDSVYFAPECYINCVLQIIRGSRWIVTEWMNTIARQRSRLPHSECTSSSKKTRTKCKRSYSP